jgi:tRNA dimethylallyltransferase
MFLEEPEIKKIERELKKDNSSINKIKSRAIKTRKVVLICGPSCTGKTRIAINLARILETDIISLDSMQVYRGMDIGTDKYDTLKLGIKQYMVDIFDPDQRVSAVEFRNICRSLIDSDFFKKKKVPLMAGGSGLYIRAVMDDLDFVSDRNNIQDFVFRDTLRKEIEKNGIKNVYRRLKVIDPEYAEKIGKSDYKRIIRAMEVYNITGIPFSNFQDKWNERKSVYNCTMIGLIKEKKNIEKCIIARVETMLKKGLIGEVKRLIGKGYEDCNSLMQAVGYKEVIEFLHKNGKTDTDKLKESIIKNTKKLVKKQRTWFKADPRINWISVDNYDNMLSSIIKVLKILRSDL